MYEKYAKPKKNEMGVYDKVGVLKQYKARTFELKNQFRQEIIMSHDAMITDENAAQMDLELEDINLTN